jgi:hypothetical protein
VFQEWLLQRGQSSEKNTSLIFTSQVSGKKYNGAYNKYEVRKISAQPGHLFLEGVLIPAVVSGEQSCPALFAYRFLQRILPRPCVIKVPFKNHI